MSDEKKHPSDKQLIRMAYAMALTGKVDLTYLSDTDARFVWRIIWSIIQRRRDMGTPQPTPKDKPRETQSSAQIQATVRRLGGDNPGSIIVEIMQEPLLQAAILMLSAMMNLPVPVLVFSMPVSGEDGP